MAAPTPMGANFITYSVNRNIMSASDWHQFKDHRCFDPIAVAASAKITAKTTIPSMSPSAIAFMIDVGARWEIMSLKVCGLAGGSPAVSA
jgi:hypothetical protein